MVEKDEFYIEETPEEEAKRQARRKERLEKMKREKKRALLIQRRVIPITALCVVILFAISFAAFLRGSLNSEKQGREPENDAVLDESGEPEREEISSQQAVNIDAASLEQQEEPYEPQTMQKPIEVFRAERTAETTGFSDKVISEYGVLIDVEEKSVLASQNERTRISPASMTKILTVLTAADALGINEDNWETNPVLDDKFTITIQITDYSFVNDCSNVGFEVGEEVTVRDLFYGTILPSGADAAVGLACYVSGSQEEFVNLMNQKLEELDMADSSHMMNCVGLYHEEHYSTVTDIAVILKTAADNPFCREVLSAHIHTTEATKEHPEGMILSNWFLRRIEDKDTHGEVICAKTGFVVQSKNCAASLARDVNGKEYICVTAGSTSSWRCIYDHVEMYQQWLPAAEN